MNQLGEVRTFEPGNGPYSYRAGVFQLVTPLTSVVPRSIKSEGKTIDATISLRRAFWVFQSAGFTCLVVIEVFVEYVQYASYVKFAALAFLLLASECAFLERRKSKRNISQDDKAQKTEC